MLNKLVFKVLSKESIPEVAALGQNLNPAYSLEMLSAFLDEMFAYNSYHCFGLFNDNELVAILQAVGLRYVFIAENSWKWITFWFDRIYSQRGLVQSFSNIWRIGPDSTIAKV